MTERCDETLVPFIREMWTIRCKGCCTLYEVGRIFRIEGASDRLARKGWRSINGKPYCPDCAKLRQQEEQPNGVQNGPQSTGGLDWGDV
jgi:hypothetical protein